ncbi:Foldase protein PrsA 2 precursor [Planctomycetes bacterium Pan216]|uniref:peptidylprolyl isomerase n=1 Tax=Kolteria novifilia TaxID=2527975 RepID=A0A518B8P9_9BACT|nr:Foldase protein PrsA 2 precursor [Planctomycetes bacterium Pan216]
MARWATRYAILVVVGITSALAPHAEAADLIPIFSKKKTTKVTTTKETPAERPEQIVAEVNGEKITRDMLADELIDNHGEQQLDAMINRLIIAQACRENNIDITREMIEEEIAKRTKQLNLTRREFVQRVLASRGISMGQYIRDTIAPALALKALCEDKIEVTDEDLQKAFQATYGEKVEVRMLIVHELRRAHELWEEVNKVKGTKERLQRFEDLCKTYSVDQASRPYGGKTQPISRHSGYPEIEDLAFGLEPGELSKIVQVPNGNMMLLCVRRVEERTDVTLDSKATKDSDDTVRDYLTKGLNDRKLRREIATFFESQREAAIVNNYLTADFDANAVVNGVTKPKAASPNAN